MLFPGLGANNSMSQAAREVEQGSMERRLKAPGPAGAGDSVLGGLCTETFCPRLAVPHRGGATEKAVVGWGAPRRPRAGEQGL